MRISLAPAGAGGIPVTIAGAASVARRVLAKRSPLAHLAQPVLVNGAAGVIVGPRDDPISIVGFTVADGMIVEIDLIADPSKMQSSDMDALPYS